MTDSPADGLRTSYNAVAAAYVEMSLERAPYISIEAPTQRGYLLARA